MMKVSLDYDDFVALISGKTIRREKHHFFGTERVEIFMQDIGYVEMLKVIMKLQSELEGNDGN